MAGPEEAPHGAAPQPSGDKPTVHGLLRVGAPASSPAVAPVA